MGTVIQFRPQVKDQRPERTEQRTEQRAGVEQMALDLVLAERSLEICRTYLSCVSPTANKSVGREINALRQELSGRPRGPQPGAALRAPLRRAA